MSGDHLKLSTLMKGLRQGCVCHISNEEFASFVHEGVKLIHEIQDSHYQKSHRKNLLSFLTFLYQDSCHSCPPLFPFLPAHLSKFLLDQFSLHSPL